LKSFGLAVRQEVQYRFSHTKHLHRQFFGRSDFRPDPSKLRELLLEFSKLTLPYIDIREEIGLKPAKTPRERDAETDQAKVDYNTLFREYVIQYATFKRVAAVFLMALLLMISAAAWQLPFTYQKVLSALVGCSLAIGGAAYLKPTIAPDPGNLLSIDHIGKQFANLNYLSALRLSDLKVCWACQIDGALPFRLQLDVWLSGFKYLFAVTDKQNERLFLLSYGSISGNTKYFHVLDPGASHFAVDLGNLNYSALPKPKPELKMILWLFVPLPITWIQIGDNFPRILLSDITDKLGDRTEFLLNQPSLNIDHLDKSVTFQRKQDWFSGITWTFETDQKANPVLKKFAKKLKTANRIKTKIYLHGLDLAP
jgi:hypothetical protein